MRRRISGIAAVALALSACASDGSTEGATTTVTEATTTVALTPLTVLVTDDDGIGAPGIDVLVNALLDMEAVEVVVVAPAENQSGSSDKTTPGGAPYAPGATASGVEGTAVDGFPADSIAVALDELGLDPDVVASGINEGQNTGPFTGISGTVGAARTAARRGIPAVAGSAGLGETADYTAAAVLVVEWIEANRTALAEGTLPLGTVTSFNVPTCTAGVMKDEVLEVPTAAVLPEGLDPFTSDCTIEPLVPPADDVAAVAAGYASVTLVPVGA